MISYHRNAVMVQKLVRKVLKKLVTILCFNRSLAALQDLTSSWRPFGPLDFVLRALRALRPVCRACILTIFAIFE